MGNDPFATREGGPAEQVRNARRHTGWLSVAMLGTLLLMPAELARADEDRGERAPSARASSGSRSSGSAPKASPPSRSSSRSQPRASTRSSSRSQPRASSRSSRPRTREQAAPTRRSSGATQSRSNRRVEARERQHRAPETRRRGDARVRSESPRGRTPLKIENVQVIDRTEISAPDGSAPKVEGTRPSDRTEPRPRLTRPRYETPAERSPNRRSARPNANIDRGELDRDGDWRRHYEIEEVAPAERNRTPRGRDGYDKHRGRDHKRHYRGGHRHRHRYGCGHYGYGHYPYGYDPFGLFSPYIHLNLGGYDAPEIYPYVGGGGRTVRYRDAGHGALDLDLRPESTEIYVDGSYVGVADDYDGFPTYLWLEEGTYEIAFYKQGYETIFRQYTIYPGVTIDVNDRMRRGESIPPTPASAYSTSSETGYSSTTPPRTDAEPRLPAIGEDGRIAIVATPGDAAVYLDGHFVGTAEEISELSAGLIVEPGEHVVDIIRPGYENQQVPVSVAKGERIDLKLDLRR